MICLQGVGFFDCIAVFCVAEGVTLFAGGGGAGFGGFWAVAPPEKFWKIDHFREFPSCPKLLFQSEASGKASDMKMTFHSDFSFSCK